VKFDVRIAQIIQGSLAAPKRPFDNENGSLFGGLMTVKSRDGCIVRSLFFQIKKIATTTPKFDPARLFAFP
jgi:hypothetical protein